MSVFLFYFVCLKIFYLQTKNKQLRPSFLAMAQNPVEINDNGVFPKWIRNSVNSANVGNLTNHRSINWAQFKDPLGNLCLAGAVVAS